jgi:CheY-like chemotaxis protein
MSGPEVERVEEISGGTILVAEDEKGVRRAFRSVLEEAGFTVIEAEDGVEAVELFRKRAGEIDLVIFDVVMPQMGGVEAYDRIRKMRPDVKAIFISGYAADASITRSIIDRGLHYISKPVLPDQLLARIRKVVAE